MKKYISMSIVMAIIFYFVHKTLGEPSFYVFMFGCLIGGLEAIVLFDD